LLSRSNRFRRRIHKVRTLRGAYRSACPSAINFAQRLAFRYRHRAEVCGRLAQVLPLQRPSFTKRDLHHHFSIKLAPHLLLELRRAQTIFRHHTSESIGRTEIYSNQGRAVKEHLVTRILTRVERAEVPPAALAKTRQMVLAGPRRATQTETADWPAKERTQQVPPAAIGLRTVLERPPGLATAPLDVQRLTDEVVQAIDRRIVAERERLGRI
jgi:hypothetical protein